MSLVINTNNTASSSLYSFGTTSSQLQQNLAALSSGTRLTSSSVDAGGLAVSTKLNSAMSRTSATNTNVQNSISFLQTQDGVLRTAGSILDRMSELKVMSNDFTKNESDLAGYDAEFNELSQQLEDLQGQTFNGVNLFSEEDGALSVSTTESGGGEVTISQADFNASGSSVSTITSASSLSELSVQDFTNATDEVALQRAVNGSQQSRMLFASQNLYTSLLNLANANSLIADTDYATASTAYAQTKFQYQSNLAMLTQANSNQETVLNLLA
ncbi:MAG: flagellin [Opitutales bacterium]